MWKVMGYLYMFVAAVLAQSETLVVQTDQGPVRGYADTEGKFFSFQNIPYATAPTGLDKFKAPLPAPVWTEPFEAVDRGIICPQFERFISRPHTAQEDCLVANIFVPNTTRTNLPVLVSVHGGGHQYGYGNSYQLTSLVKTNRIISVTFNYRLGAHGFLCLGTDDAPGNAGMKDQVALLRWVQRNIASFGGNPGDVTIHGCSAGGSSVDLLSLSPMSAGLYQKSITASGAGFGPTGVQMDPVNNAKTYAKYLNQSNVDDINALKEFYKTASYELLLSGFDFIWAREDLLFSPCVERQTGEERFLDDAPLNIFRSGNYYQVPNLYGFANMEGLFRLDDFNEIMEGINEKFSDFLPLDLQFESEEQKEAVANRIKEFYFGNETISEETILSYVDYLTDKTFAYPMLRSLNLRREARNDTVYLYEYSFVDENTPVVPNTNVRGSTHCAQLFVVRDYDSTSATEEHNIMSENMREMWLNFAVSGNPVPEGSSQAPWLPVSGLLSPYMKLNATTELVHSPLLDERVRFWNSIYEQHYRVPVPPSSYDTEAVSSVSVISSSSFQPLQPYC